MVTRHTRGPYRPAEVPARCPDCGTLVNADDTALGRCLNCGFALTPIDLKPKTPKRRTK
jgi:hypothetical protein